MFSKGVILIFLILGLSSSIAHAIPHQNRAQDPCTDNTNTNKHSTVLDKGTDETTTKKGGRKKTGTDKSGHTNTSTNESGHHHTATNKTGDANTSTDKPKKKTQPKLTGTGTSKDQINGKNSLASGNKNDTGNNGGDPQTSLTLDQSVINQGSKSDGLNNATAGTAASLTSTNNFINFCVGKTITSGQQTKTGSCNPIPMGDIASTTNLPSCKYVSPKNLDTLKSNTQFTMTLAVKNIQLGVFTNAETNYYAAPQQLNKQGNIIGHTHLLIEQVDSLTSTTPTTPTNFAFFKGIDDPAGNDGTVSTDVTAGLPPGVYRFGTIMTSANHAPVLGAVAQHGIYEDCIYVTVTQDGKADTGGGGTGNAGNGTAGNGNAGNGNAGNGNTGNNNNSTATNDKEAAKRKKGKNGKVDKATGTVNNNKVENSAIPSPSPSTIFGLHYGRT